MAFFCAPSTGVMATPVTTGFAPRTVASERLRSGGDGARRDHGDLLVVHELLAAGRAFFLVRLDEALDECDRMAVDATELVVDVLDGELGACGRQPADDDLAALLVDPADVDLRLLRVGLPALPMDVGEVVRHRRAGARRGGRCRAPPTWPMRRSRAPARRAPHPRARCYGQSDSWLSFHVTRDLVVNGTVRTTVTTWRMSTRVDVMIDSTRSAPMLSTISDSSMATGRGPNTRAPTQSPASRPARTTCAPLRRTGPGTRLRRSRSARAPRPWAWSSLRLLRPRRT